MLIMPDIILMALLLTLAVIIIVTMSLSTLLLDILLYITDYRSLQSGTNKNRESFNNTRGTFNITLPSTTLRHLLNARKMEIESAVLGIDGIQSGGESIIQQCTPTQSSLSL